MLSLILVEGVGVHMNMNHEAGDNIQAGTVVINGTVKWFNAVKGFGFICPNDGTGDVFLHLSCLRDAGYDSVPEGAGIVCEAVQRPKGMQAVRVIELDSSSATARRSAPRQAASGAHSVPAGEGDFLAATVKWFNPVKGYGFVSCGEGTQDVFVHMEVLRRAEMNELEPGQVVRIRVGQGSKGPQVAEIQRS